MKASLNSQNAVHSHQHSVQVSEETVQGVREHAEALMATSPSVDPDEISRLNALVAEFRDAHERVTDESAIREARQAERAASLEVERLVVLLDIGRATQAEVTAARDVQANARTTLEILPRRAAAIAGELRKMRKEIQDARLALLQAFSPWEEQFAPVSKRLADIAVELLFLAASTSHFAGRYPFAPSDRLQLAAWAETTNAFGIREGHGAVELATMPKVAIEARRALAEAHEVGNTRIPAPTETDVPRHHLHESTAGHLDKNA